MRISCLLSQLLREQRLKGSHFKTSPGKKITRCYLNKNKMGMLSYSIIPAMREAQIEGLSSEAGLRQKKKKVGGLI
jgi:hypothetical protein